MSCDPTEARVEAYVREWIDARSPLAAAEARAALLALVRQEREDARREAIEECVTQCERQCGWAPARCIRARLAAPQQQASEALDVWEWNLDGWSSAAAVATAYHVLRVLREMGVRPSRVAVTDERSIMIAFLRDTIRANIEVFEDGQAAAAIVPKGQRPTVWGIDGEHGLRSAIRDIADAIAAPRRAEERGDG